MLRPSHLAFRNRESDFRPVIDWRPFLPAVGRCSGSWEDMSSRIYELRKPSLAVLGADAPGRATADWGELQFANPSLVLHPQSPQKNPLITGPIHVTKCMTVAWICPRLQAYALTSEFQIAATALTMKNRSTYLIEFFAVLMRLIPLRRMVGISTVRNLTTLFSDFAVNSRPDRLASITVNNPETQRTKQTGGISHGNIRNGS